MEMFWTIVIFIIGLILIIKGGDIFVDAASWIAEKSGIPKFIIGATIVSIATTLPEMVASILGTMQGSLGLAVGNAVGSVTANTGMIMAISILFMPVAIDKKQYSFKCILLMVITFVLGFLLAFIPEKGKLTLVESFIMLLLTVAFFWENIVSAKRISSLTKNLTTEDVEANQEEKEEKKDIFERLFEKLFKSKAEIILNICKFILGAAGIYFGAKFLVDKGTIIAQSLGVSDAVIGLTLVAIGTSLPELVTTITAICKKQSSLSVGNIVGANIIDMSLILPICGFVSGGTLTLESMQTVYLDIPVSLAIMLIAFVPSLIRGKFSRLQGALMLIIYVAYLVVICGGFIQF